MVELKLRTFNYVSRSLFKSDRLMFGMHLVHCLHPDRFGDDEWEFFTGELVPTDWDTALDRAYNSLRGVAARHGANALAFISSSRATNEENYLVQKLARAAFGTNNCHQCSAT